MVHCQKILDYVVKSKLCVICQKYKKIENIPEHDCTKNHEGSSKSMEVDGILEMVVNMFEKNNVSVMSITADDDTTMIAHLTHPKMEKGGNKQTKFTYRHIFPFQYIGQTQPTAKRSLASTCMHLPQSPTRLVMFKKEMLKKL